MRARPRRAALLLALVAALLCAAGWEHFRIAGLLGPIGAGAVANPPRLAFWQRVPEPIQTHLADDIKLLIGWTFDAAAGSTRPAPGRIVDRRSSFAAVPGFAPPTSLEALDGRYRVERVFDEGRGYYGIELAALDARDRVGAVLLLNRLFRAPLALRDPGGLLTDVLTNGAMLMGCETAAVADAEAAAEAALFDADASGVSLLTGGQSQAGGLAQLQAAYLQHRHPGSAAGFITFNAWHVLASVHAFGFAGADVAGVNFSKDLDPGVGPKAPLANRVGFQVYIHRDRSGSRRPGDTTLFDALLHPRQHFLDSFNDVSVSAALGAALGEH
jgi:hypothetical protein